MHLRRKKTCASVPKPLGKGEDQRSSPHKNNKKYHMADTNDLKNQLLGQLAVNANSFNWGVFDVGDIPTMKFNDSSTNLINPQTNPQTITLNNPPPPSTETTNWNTRATNTQKTGKPSLFGTARLGKIEAEVNPNTIKIDYQISNRVSNPFDSDSDDEPVPVNKGFALNLDDFNTVKLSTSSDSNENTIILGARSGFNDNTIVLGNHSNSSSNSNSNSNSFDKPLGSLGLEMDEKTLQLNKNDANFNFLQAPPPFMMPGPDGKPITLPGGMDQPFPMPMMVPGPDGKPMSMPGMPGMPGMPMMVPGPDGKPIPFPMQGPMMIPGPDGNPMPMPMSGMPSMPMMIPGPDGKLMPMMMPGPDGYPMAMPGMPGMPMMMPGPDGKPMPFPMHGHGMPMMMPGPDGNLMPMSGMPMMIQGPDGKPMAMPNMPGMPMMMPGPDGKPMPFPMPGMPMMMPGPDGKLIPMPMMIPGPDGKPMPFPMMPIPGMDGQLLPNVPMLIPGPDGKPMPMMPPNVPMMPGIDNSMNPIVIQGPDGKPMLAVHGPNGQLIPIGPAPSPVSQDDQATINLSADKTINLSAADQTINLSLKNPISLSDDKTINLSVDKAITDTSQPFGSFNLAFLNKDNTANVDAKLPELTTQKDIQKALNINPLEKAEEKLQSKSEDLSKMKKLEAKTAQPVEQNLKELIMTSTLLSEPIPQTAQTTESMKNDTTPRAKSTIKGQVPSDWGTLRPRASDKQGRPQKKGVGLDGKVNVEEGVSTLRTKTVQNLGTTNKRQQLKLQEENKKIERFHKKQQKEFKQYKEKSDAKYQLAKMKYEQEVEKIRINIDRDQKAFEKQQEKQSKTQDNQFEEETKNTEAKQKKKALEYDQKLQELRKTEKNAFLQKKTKLSAELKRDMDSKKRNKYTFDKTYIKKFKFSQKMDLQVQEMLHNAEMEFQKAVSDFKLLLEQQAIACELVQHTGKELAKVDLNMLRDKNNQEMENYNKLIDQSLQQLAQLHAEEIATLKDLQQFQMQQFYKRFKGETAHQTSLIATSRTLRKKEVKKDKESLATIDKEAAELEKNTIDQLTALQEQQQKLLEQQFDSELAELDYKHAKEIYEKKIEAATYRVSLINKFHESEKELFQKRNEKDRRSLRETLESVETATHKGQQNTIQLLEDKKIEILDAIMREGKNLNQEYKEKLEKMVVEHFDQKLQEVKKEYKLSNDILTKRQANALLALEETFEYHSANLEAKCGQEKQEFQEVLESLQNQ